MTSTDRHDTGSSDGPAETAPKRPAASAEGQPTGFPPDRVVRAFGWLSVLSFVAYLGFSLTVRAFLGNANTMLARLVELMPWI